MMGFYVLTKSDECALVSKQHEGVQQRLGTWCGSKPFSLFRYMYENVRGHSPFSLFRYENVRGHSPGA